jgi:hypothetical protein
VQLFEQQSPLPEQVEVAAAQQVFPVPHVVRSPHALSPLQAELAAHPHAPAVHVGPGPHVPTQLVHVAPVPHASSPVPLAHAPEASQHPPLHAVSFVPPHAAAHWCVIVLQAWPAVVPFAARQSVAELHPHVSVEASH